MRRQFAFMDDGDGLPGDYQRDDLACVICARPRRIHDDTCSEACQRELEDRNERARTLGGNR